MEEPVFLRVRINTYVVRQHLFVALLCFLAPIFNTTNATVTTNTIVTTNTTTTTSTTTGTYLQIVSHTWANNPNETNIPFHKVGTWVDPGTLCEDQFGVSIPVTRTVIGNLNVLGTISIRYDCRGIVLEKPVVVRNTFQMNGPQSLTLAFASSVWIDPWATCIDDAGSFVTVTSNYPASISLAATPFSTEIVYDIEYTCLGEIQNQTRSVTVRKPHYLRGNGIQYLRVCYPQDVDCYSWIDPGSDCYDFASHSAATTTISYSSGVSIDRSTPNMVVVSYSNCPSAAVLKRTIYVREPIVLNGDFHMRARTGNGFWVDPGGDCIDAYGTFYNLTTDLPDGALSVRTLGIYNITYSCQVPYTSDVVRQVEVRDALVLDGPIHQFLITTDSWTNLGATCINDDGTFMGIVDGNSLIVNTATAGVKEVTYSCRRRETPDKKRYVNVYDPFILNGNETETVRLDINDTYADKGATCLGPGAVPMEATSERRRFVRDTERTETITYNCRRRYPGEAAPPLVELIRTIVIKVPFQVKNYIRQNNHTPQRIRVVEIGGMWTDPGAECIDDYGFPITPITASHSGISLTTPLSFTVTYNCRRRYTPDVTRDVQIRNALILLGLPQYETRTKSSTWIDPGADCIDTAGLQASVSVQHTLNGVSSSGASFSLASEGVYTLSYDCTGAGQEQRTVKVRDALKIYGGRIGDPNKTIHVWSNPGVNWIYAGTSPETDCIADNGSALSVTKYIDGVIDGTFPLTSPGKNGISIHNLTYECADTPNVTREVHVRDAIRVFGADPFEIMKQGDFDAPATVSDPGVDAIDVDGDDISSTVNLAYTDPAGNSCTSSCTGSTPLLSAAALGTYTATFSAIGTQTAPYASTQTRQIQVTRAIKINGSNPETILKEGEFGAPASWTDMSATCRDRDGDAIVPTVDPAPATISRATVATHYVEYTCEDGSGRTVKETRTIHVIHPITLSGSNPLKVKQADGSFWSDPGSWCVEPVPMDSNNLINRTLSQSPADNIISLGAIGDSQVTYTCTSSGSHTASLIRVVSVVAPFTLLGSNPDVRLKGSSPFWVDPGALCLSDSGDMLAWSNDLATQYSLAANNEKIVIYTCVDGATTLTIERRIVTTEPPGVANTILVASNPDGNTEMTIVVGETFTDPGACCVDGNAYLLQAPSTLGIVNNAVPGPNTLVYTCIGLSGDATTTERVVKVNEAPTVSLYGDTTTRVTPEAEYVDAGAWCYDQEDGTITMKAQGTDDHSVNLVRAGALGITSGRPESVIDGDYGTGTHPDDAAVKIFHEATKSGAVCQSCITATLVWVDMGVSRQVKKVTLKQPSFSSDVEAYIGDTVATSQTVNGILCKSSTSNTNSLDMTCQPNRLVGRILTIKSAANDAFTICEVLVTGRPGPTAPPEFEILTTPAVCTGVTTGLFRAKTVEAAEGLVYQQYDTGTNVWGTATIRRVSTSVIDATWVLRDGANVDQAEAPGLALYPPMEGWIVVSGGGVTCTGVTVQVKPEDLCTWLFKYNPNSNYFCGDNTECSGEGCCAAKGGVKFCPTGNKYLCAAMCSGDHCCAGYENPTCDSKGGTLQCAQAQLNATLLEDTTYSSYIGPRIETVNTVNTAIIGEWKVFYTCVDSVGAISVAARTILVGCEIPGGPNPLYTGNNVNCSNDIGVATSQADYTACETVCLNDVLCEAYTFSGSGHVTGNCQKKSGCTGKYLTSVTSQVAAVCRRLDKPPTVVLGESAATAKQHGTWTAPQCDCVDLEDSSPPNCVDDEQVSFDNTVAGVHTITYTCTDTATNVATAVRSVIIQSSCPAPTADNAANPFCTQGALIPRDSVCTLQCAATYQPSVETLVCTSSSDTKPESHFSTLAYGAEEIPQCGKSKCTEPVVRNTKSVGALATPCVESQQNAADGREGEIIEFQKCTPNCLDGYNATSGPLTCSGGRFLNDDGQNFSAFECLKRATSPVSLFSGTQRYVTMDIGWYGGTPHDCQFAGWQIQGRRLAGSLGVAGDGTVVEDYHDLPGCTPSDFTKGRDEVNCTAHSLVEGGTYDLRVRESCGREMVNSVWLEVPTAYTLKYVFAPEVLLASPNGTGENGVLSSPGQIVLAVSVGVVKGLSGGGSISLVREYSEANKCPGANFVVAPLDVFDGQPEEGQVGLINGRIFLVLPPSGFFEPGCDYQVTFAAGSMQTDLEPRKGNDEFQWRFTYIDEKPIQTLLARVAQEITPTGIKTTLALNYHLASKINCTTTRVNSASDVYTVLNLDQMSDDYVVNFELPDQLPNSEFAVVCSGHKAGKEHVLVEPHTQWVYKTMKDDNVDFNPMSISKFAECGNGTEFQVVASNTKSEEQLKLGEVLLIRSYEKFCNNNNPLSAGENAIMKLRLSVQAWSNNAQAKWSGNGAPNGNGPDLNFFFTKPGAGALSNQSTLEQTAVFYICPHANAAEPSTYPCKEYTLVVVCVDLVLEIMNPDSGGIAYGTSRRLPMETIPANQLAYSDGSSRRLASFPQTLGPGMVLGPGTTAETLHINMTMGLGMRITISTSDSVIDWSDVTIGVGSLLDAFKQHFTYVKDAANNTIITIPSVQGVGIYLPLMFDFENVQFDMKLFISFRTPEFRVVGWSAPPTAAKDVQAIFTNGMPTDAQVVANAIAETYISLKIVKEGNDFQFCGSTQFVPPGSWTNRTCKCTLGQTIASPLVVKLLIKNYNTGAWWLSTEREVRGIEFTPPGLTAMTALRINGEDASDTNMAMARIDVVPKNDLGAKQELLIGGVNFPDLSTVQKDGAVIPDYQLYMQPEPNSMIDANTPAPEVPVCNVITYVNDVQLRCEVFECLDVRFLKLQPELVLQLGDLRSGGVQNLLRLPRPVMAAFSPEEILDVGVFNFMFSGSYLGVGCNTTPINDPLCQGACAAWIADGRPGTGAVQIFGNATILIGQAPCKITLQNDTRVMCTSSTSVRPQRAVPLAGEILGQINFALKATLSFSTGAHLVPEMDMKVDTSLMQCQVGEQRVREDSAVCEKCIAGKYSHTNSDQWPLLCSWCGASTFNDQAGMTGCMACPANTVSGLPPDDISRCTCTTGFYSQYLDEFKIAGLPGKPCESCSSIDMTDETPSGTRCGQDFVNVPLCNVPTTHVCAPPDPSSYSYRYCQVSCAGGMGWPTAKPGYFISGQTQVSAGNTSTATQYKPVIVECDPPISCSGGNVCGAGYAGFGCVECQAPPLKPYYREKLTNLCQPCGEGQIIGTIIMAAVGVMLSLGAFIGSLFYMKLLGDPVFKNQVDTLFKEHITKPVMRIVKQTGMSEWNKWRRRVTFTKRDLCVARSWITRRDLGMVFRVSPEDRKVYVSGVRENTPALASGIRANWRLVLVNGENVKGLTEEEIKSQIAMAKMPIMLTFRAPPAKDTASISDEDAEAGATGGASTAANGMRMLTMSLGVAQSFKGIMSLDMEWPPFFTQVAYIVQNLLLNFDFFHPECSVAAPYWQKWLGFAVLPYGMFFPLLFSAGALKLMHVITSERYRKDVEFANIQDWMLRNAMCRTILITMLLFVNFHFTQLIQPFSCIEREPDVYVLTESQSTECSVDNEVYRIVFVFSCVGWCIALGGFSFLMLNLYKGYYWQVGVDVRDELPWWMAMLEASTAAMKGYKQEVRTRIYSNVVAVKMFPVQKELMKFREQLSVAINDVGHRSRRVKSDLIQDEQGLEVEDTMDRRRDIIIAKDLFNTSMKWTSDLDGNVLTYGWVLMVNTLARQLALMLCVVFSAAFPPFGAAGQSLVFIVNFLMIASNKPYMSDTLNFQEAMLIGCMGALTFMATFKELLSQHKRAPDYPQTIDACAMLIDVLVLCIVLIICSVMFGNICILAMRALSMEDSSAMLNRVHFERIMSFEKGEERVKGIIAKREVLEARDQNFGNILLMDLKMLENQCKPQQWGQFRQGANTLLHLFNQTLAQEKDDECFLNNDQIEAFGLRPTTQHLVRRKGSGIFTDILSKCLMECAAKYGEDNSTQNLKNAPFKGLAAMLIAWIEKDVGEQRMRSKLKSQRAKKRTQARKIAELTISQLIDRVIKHGERTKGRTLQELVESDEAYANWDFMGEAEHSVWNDIGGLLGDEGSADFLEEFGPVMDAEWDPDQGFANWWDDVGPTGWDGTEAQDEYGWDDHGWDDLGPAEEYSGVYDDLGPAQYSDLGPAEYDGLLGSSQSQLDDLGPADTNSATAKPSRRNRKKQSVAYTGGGLPPAPEPPEIDLGDLGPSLEDLGPLGAEDIAGEFDDIGDLGPSLDDLGPGLDDIGPGLDDIGPGLDDIGPGLDDIGPGLDDIGPGLDDIGPSLDDLGPSLDDLGPSLDMLGPSMDMLGPSVDAPRSLPALPKSIGRSGPNRISASIGSYGVSGLGIGGPMSQPRLGNDLGLIPEDASPKAEPRPKAKPLGLPKAKPLGKPSSGIK